MATYVDANVIVKREWEVEQTRHKENLMRIEKELPPRIDNKRPASFTRQFRKERAKEFYQLGESYAEMNEQIRKENHKLLSKLVEISGGTNVRKSATRRRGSNSATWRRKRQVEVAAANHLIATRLSSTTSTFSVRRWEESFGRSQRYKRMISRPHQLPRTTPDTPKEARSRSGLQV